MTRLPRWVLAALVVPSFLDESAGFLPAGALEGYRRTLGLSYAQAGTVLTMLALGSVAGSAASIAVDHVSRRFLAAGGAAGLALAMAGFALSPWYWGLLMASAVHGLAATVMMDSTGVALAEAVGEERLRPYLARANVAGVAGDVGGPLVLGAALGLGLGWRAAFTAAALALAAYAAVLAAAPLPAPAGHDPDPAADPVGSAAAGSGPRAVLGQVVRDPMVWLVAGLSLLITPFDEPFLGFLLARAEHDAGLGPGGLTFLAVVSVAGGLVAYTVLEARLRRVGDATTIVTGAVLMAAGALVAGTFDGAPTLAAGGAIVGIGMALTWVALEHRQLTLRPGQAGTTAAVVGAVQSIGFLVPSGVGAIADRVGLGAAVAGHAGLALLLAAGARGLRRREPTP